MNISGINLLSGILNKFGTVGQFHQTHFSHVFYCTIQTHLWFRIVDRNDWNWDTKVHNLLMCPQHTIVDQWHKKWGRWSFPCILTLFFWCCCLDKANLWTRPSVWSQLQTSTKFHDCILNDFDAIMMKKICRLTDHSHSQPIKYDSLVSGSELQTLALQVPLWRYVWRRPSSMVVQSAGVRWLGLLDGSKTGLISRKSKLTCLTWLNFCFTQTMTFSSD